MDADALAAARENVDRNGTAEAITLRAVEIGRDAAEDLDRFDVVTANLTGALLERHAPAIASWTRASGTLIASGYQSEEAESVTAALRHAGFALVEQIGEDEWVGGRFQRSS
jgi:ribosomal protein L11 methylase PrmA